MACGNGSPYFFATMIHMNKRGWITGALVVGIVVLAAWFRLYDIQNFPPGLFPDEAANGEDALLILDGDWRPFYPRGNGREALFYYLQAGSIKLFEIGVWQLHVVSAMIGIVTVLSIYFATRVWFGRLSGLLATFFLATSYWHVTLSRTGFRAILIPLFVALFTAWVGYVVRSMKRGQIKRAYVYAALAGAAFAGGFYTYIAFRIMVGVVLGIALLLLLAAVHPKVGLTHWQRYGKQIVVGILAAMIVFAPLGWFFVQEPEAFVGRAGQVSVFNKELQQEYGGGTLVGTILYSTRETIISFFAGEGDLNWRHNVAGFPLLNPLVGLLGLLGLTWAIHGTVMCAFKMARGKELHLDVIFPYLLLLLGGMLAPVVTTAEGIPHGLRSIGLVIPIFMLAGTAGSVALYWIKRKISWTQWQAAGFGVVAGLLILSGLYDGALYFMIARNDAGAHYAYRADLTRVAGYIIGLNLSNEPKPYLVLDKFSLQTVHFLTSVEAHDHTVGDEEHPDKDKHLWKQLNPEQSHVQALQPGEKMIFTQSTLPDADRYAKHYKVKIVEQEYNRFGQEIMRVLELDVENQVPTNGGGLDA
jgi:4-amino-4-deoxy-L-arabinose transferase-like glycosyltransferase